jgi:hypothetical protein
MSGLLSPVVSVSRKKHDHLSRADQREARARLSAARGLMDAAKGCKSISRLPAELEALWPAGEAPTNINSDTWPKVEQEIRRRILSGLEGVALDGDVVAALEKLVSNDLYRRANGAQVRAVMLALQGAVATGDLDVSDLKVIVAAGRWITDIDALRGKV